MEDIDHEEMAEVEEVILGVQQECLAANDLTPANSNSLNEIFDLARATYDKDSKGWDLLFGNLTSELSAASDEDEAAVILDDYRRKAQTLK